VEATALDLRRFLSSVSLSPAHARESSPDAPAVATTPDPAVATPKENAERFLAGLAALVFNVDPVDGRLPRGGIQELVLEIDEAVQAQINAVLHNPRFQAVESAWRSVEDLTQHTNFRANIRIDILDVSQEELLEDFENNSVDVTGAALFKKVYVQEYDQYGGRPFGAIIGLFSFGVSPKNIIWLRQMGRICSLAHAPFVASVAPQFFGCETPEQLVAIRDLAGLLRHPRYGAWEKLRDSPEAAFLALCLPRYLLRKPYHPERNPGGELPFAEKAGERGDADYLWGSASVLFARNLARSFERSGWCQNIRGPKGGGMIGDLVQHEFAVRDDGELKAPLEVSIPDHNELQFANAGFIPLIYKPQTGEACFFSCQSLKLPKRFDDAKSTENAQLLTNLSYTLSITRIAHYLKCMIRDDVGTTADAAYVQNRIENWLSEYVTKVINPDDRTLRFYPFKGLKVEVKEAEGLVGKYRCSVTIVPHIQFEGIDVELKLESRLG
jgi:type VI secretion system protein ImpC